MAVLGKCEYDNLIADTAHAVTGGTVVIAGGEGNLKKGSILGRNSSNKFEFLDSDVTGNAEVILAEDCVGTSQDGVVPVYLTGDFLENELKKYEGYTLTEADRKSLKDAGIYLVSGQEN